MEEAQNSVEKIEGQPDRPTFRFADEPMGETTMKQPAREHSLEDSNNIARLVAAVRREDGPARPVLPSLRVGIPVLRWAASGVSLVEFLADDSANGLSD